MKRAGLALLLAVLLGTPLAAAAQDARPSNGTHEPLRVFLDCNSCDFDYVRREVPFVNYVRDRRSRAWDRTGR